MFERESHEARVSAECLKQLLVQHGPAQRKDEVVTLSN
jgi:hypothetical protein